MESFANHFLNEFENISLVIYAIGLTRTEFWISFQLPRIGFLGCPRRKVGIRSREQGKLKWFIKKENQSGVSFGRRFCIEHYTNFRKMISFGFSMMMSCSRKTV